MKNRYETDEINSLVLVNITNSPPVQRVIPIVIKKNFPVGTRLLKRRPRLLNVSPVLTHF